MLLDRIETRWSRLIGAAADYNVLFRCQNTHVLFRDSLSYSHILYEHYYWTF